MSTNSVRTSVQIAAAVAGVLGAWLFNQALGSNTVSGRSFLLYSLAGLAVLLVAAVGLSRYYTPGEDAISGDEVPAQEPRFARFLSRATLAAHRRAPDQRRPMPSTLTKKLESSVWKPRAVSVEPGITQRIVRP
jgi:hypothetical protein